MTTERRFAGARLVVAGGPVRRQLMIAFLTEMARLKADPVEAAQALGDTLAATAAQLDLTGSPMSLELRLEAFVAHVRERYPQILQEMADQRHRVFAVKGND